ncbi:NUDIX hydrolase [Saccharopolyspora mangrovi]|uniref:NUDIX domain-containing protein n=1 Tax=Saccharopolyspora mangrovi TaxID=3082379 RepID=A0ABU6A5C6_9PSEU|nr:NUDIX domain-containing protein [Saccharopolyspora sp. S2-29]MEB3366775.1 NUDIX domain-containing protein [Saccharopolyspora sp. S2-29]
MTEDIPVAEAVEVPALVRAAGTLLWRPSPQGPEVVLVHRPRYDDWSLPKGKLDPGELAAHAAAREVVEETGFEATLTRPLAQVSYSVPRRTGGLAPKVVYYFSARLRGGEFAPNDEVDELRWLPLKEARAELSYPHDARVLDAFDESRSETATVLLVRHAKAGKRSEWSGDDALRPLSEAGREQRDALHSLLPLFAPSRIYSAPRVRCEQTVAPVARDGGIDVLSEPLFSEEVYSADPSAGVRALLEVAAEGGTSVVCSQGGVIPDLVTRLADSAGLELDEVASRKGSVWTLAFRPGEPADGGQAPDPVLAAADYLPDPLA